VEVTICEALGKRNEMGGIRYEVQDGRSYEVLSGMYEVGMYEVPVTKWMV
jgi:hypothetical protein